MEYNCRDEIFKTVRHSFSMVRHCASHIETSPKPPVLISAFLETVRQS